MPEPRTSTDILRSLVKHWSPFQELVIPNCCLPGWEADLLVIRRSGWCEEVEIKVSAADFRREWTTKAEKHEALKLGRRWQVSNAPGQGLTYGGVSVADDPTLESEPDPWRGLRYFVRRPHLIRRFWFAMPGELADALLPEVPEQYGVIAVRGYNQILRKPATLKQARKVSDAERVRALQSTYHRFWSQTFARLRETPRADQGEALEWLLALTPGVTEQSESARESTP